MKLVSQHSTIAGIAIVGAALSHAMGTEAKRITIKNSCTGTKTLVMDRGNGMEYCDQVDCEGLTVGENAAFWINSEATGNDYGGATLAEVKIEADTLWYDVSKVKGFNEGIRITPSNGEHEVACHDVNCPDAYWLCDTGARELFNPNYRTSAPSVEIEFCYEGADSQPYNIPNKCGTTQREQTGSGPFSCECTSAKVGCHCNPGGPAGATLVMSPGECSDIDTCSSTSNLRL